MPFFTEGSVVLRASAATSGAAEQDAAVILPRDSNINDLWVYVNKTAEANSDNLLTVRLQARLGASTWVDLSPEYTVLTGVLTVAADGADTERTPNIVDASSVLLITAMAWFREIPSKVLRTVSVSSGTGAANTWSATAYYRQFVK